MLLQRYVIIVATAFGGAWTMIVGGLAIVGDRGAARAASAGDVWILYPTTPRRADDGCRSRGSCSGLIGTAVQLGITGRKRADITDHQRSNLGKCSRQVCDLRQV